MGSDDRSKMVPRKPARFDPRAEPDADDGVVTEERISVPPVPRNAAPVDTRSGDQAIAPPPRRPTNLRSIDDDQPPSSRHVPPAASPRSSTADRQALTRDDPMRTLGAAVHAPPPPRRPERPASPPVAPPVGPPVAPPVAPAASASRPKPPPPVVDAAREAELRGDDGLPFPGGALWDEPAIDPPVATSAGVTVPGSAAVTIPGVESASIGGANYDPFLSDSSGPMGRSPAAMTVSGDDEEAHFRGSPDDFLAGFGAPLGRSAATATIAGADAIGSSGPVRESPFSDLRPSESSSRLDDTGVSSARRADRDDTLHTAHRRIAEAEARAVAAEDRADQLAHKLAQAERRYEELKRERTVPVPIVAPMRIGYERDAQGEIRRSDDIPMSSSDASNTSSLAGSVAHGTGSVAGNVAKKGLLAALVGPKAIAVAMCAVAVYGNRQGIVQGAAWARNVPRVTQAEVTTESIAHFLQIDTVDRPLPAPRHFTSYLKQHASTTDPHAWLDPWGKRYRLDAPPLPVAVRSAGPDGVFGTSDDVVTPVYISR